MGNETIREFVVGEFRGTYPDVPVAAGVNLDEIKALDADPMYVTLPVVPKIGAVSKNGLLYDEALVGQIEAQINGKRPGGRFGHLKEEERDSAFPIPDAIWIGAKREGDTLWARSYVPPGAARDHIRRIKAVGGSIATSIYGKGNYEATGQKGVRRLTDFDLETLDFAPPERAALGYGATPIVTAEFEQETSDMNREQLIAELTVGDIPAAIREQIGGDLNRTIAELRTQVSDRDTLITSLQATVAEFRRQQFEGAVDAKVAELTNWQVTEAGAKTKLDAFRRTLRSRIVAELAGDAGKLATVVETIWADLQPLAETVRDALAGPPAIVNGKVQTGKRQLDTSPEAVAKARAQTGI